jgi:hypothetical protein
MNLKTPEKANPEKAKVEKKGLEKALLRLTPRRHE